MRAVARTHLKLAFLAIGGALAVQWGVLYAIGLPLPAAVGLLADAATMVAVWKLL